MQFRPTAIPEVIEVRPSVHKDSRGTFSELYRREWFEPFSSETFVQENQSLSHWAGTVRGLHFQTPPHAQGKLVRCVMGAVFDVAVDIRDGSPNFGRWVGVTLTASEANQLWVPPGFLHGFCTLADESIVAYKVTAYYSPENDRGVRWNDPDIGIDWPDVARAPLLSDKDSAQPLLRDVPRCFGYLEGV